MYKIYAIKPKFNIESSIVENSIHIPPPSYRIRPKQTKSDIISLDELPNDDYLYRVPGTKIGLIYSSFGQLLSKIDKLMLIKTSVQLSIDLIKRVSLKNQQHLNFSFESLELTQENVSKLSHKQLLNILTDLSNIKDEIFATLNIKNQWMEVVELTLPLSTRASAVASVIGDSFSFDQHTKNAKLSQSYLCAEELDLSK
ncbi:Conserved_hypothetical protein [Hexamita inflata]|uniref:Uncharacterized protein n=1 Tax=Hexamita inflata TaxID=28002 RepID=A0AA86N608_9EUKA|nr:Conserved hypothetical protein [Hexamita inflata]